MPNTMNEFELMHLMLHRGATKEELLSMFQYIINKEKLAEERVAVIGRMSAKYGKVD